MIFINVQHAFAETDDRESMRVALIDFIEKNDIVDVTLNAKHPNGNFSYTSAGLEMYRATPPHRMSARVLAHGIQKLARLRTQFYDDGYNVTMRAVQRNGL